MPLGATASDEGRELQTGVHELAPREVAAVAGVVFATVVVVVVVDLFVRRRRRRLP